MNFKKEYEKAFSDISAGEDFKKQLAEQMNQEKKVRSFPIRTVGTVVAAAALVLVVGAVYLTGVSSDTGKDKPGENLVASESQPVQENAGQVLAQGDDANTYPQFQVGDLAWFGNASDDAQKIQKFVELSGTDTVKEVYSSKDQDFTSEDLTENAAYARIAERVTDPATGADAPAQTIQYYKVVLTDNKTIQFEVWDESYLKIAGVETIYQLCR